MLGGPAPRPHSAAVRLFCALALVFAFYAEEGYGANCNRYVALAHALLLEGRLEITTWHETTQDTAFVDGRWYAGAAPGPTLVLLPFYAAFHALYPALPAGLRERVSRAVSQRIGASVGAVPEGFDLAEFALSVQFLTASVPPLVGATLGLLLYAYFRRRLPQRDATLAALAASLGTIVFHYSTVLFSHVMTAAAGFGAFVLLDGRARATTAPGAFAAGLLASTTITMDYLAAAVAGVLALLALARLHELRTRASFAAGFALPLLALAAYHTAAFGSPLATPYSFPAGPEGVGAHLVVASGFFGLGPPRTGVLAELAFGSRRGYFLHMPILIAGVAGLFVALRAPAERAGAAAALAIVGGLLVLNGSMQAEYYWLAATSFGPRYLIPTIPFAAAGLASIWPSRGPARRALLGLAAASVFLNWLGAQLGASDQPSDFPLADRFLPAFLEHGPQSTILANLATLVPIGDTGLMALNWIAFAALAAAATALLAAPLRAREGT